MDEIYIIGGFDTDIYLLTEMFNVVELQQSGTDTWIEANALNPEFIQRAITNWDYVVPEEMPQLLEFPLTNINEMRMDILAAVKQTSPFIIDENSVAPYGSILGKEGEVWTKTTSQAGLLLKTYQSDLFNNWLDTEAIEEINQRSRVQIDGQGGFTMESFLLMEKLFTYLNKVQLMGNTVDDWEEVITGRKNDRPTEKPIIIGGLHKSIEFDRVVCTAATEGQPLGKIAGEGVMGKKHEGGKINFKCPENGIIMGLAMITPLTDYFQGNDWDGDLETYEDIHKADFDRIGFQNLPTDWIATWETRINNDSTLVYSTVGKQPSWIHYQTNINKVYGLFAKDSEGWMVNRRKYFANSITKRIANMSTYIDPAEWNDIFAYKNRDGQNYKMQYRTDAKVRRIMSANQIPSL